MGLVETGRRNIWTLTRRDRILSATLYTILNCTVLYITVHCILNCTVHLSWYTALYYFMQLTVHNVNLNTLYTGTM